MHLVVKICGFMAFSAIFQSYLADRRVMQPVVCSNRALFMFGKNFALTLLHSERPKLYTILAFLSAVGLSRMNLDS